MSAYLEQQHSGANSPGRWVLQAKIHSYKLCTQSFLSLLMRNGWVSDEVCKYSCYIHTCYFHIAS